MKKNIFFIVVNAILFGLIGCQQNDLTNKDLTKTAIIAKEYLDEQDYKVLSYEQHQEIYKITKSKIKTLPYSFYWGIPGNNAEPYLGKVVDVEEFLLKIIH